MADEVEQAAAETPPETVAEGTTEDNSNESVSTEAPAGEVAAE